MDEYKKICEILVQLARLIVTGKTSDAVKYLQRQIYSMRGANALVWLELRRLLDGVEQSGSMGRMDGIVRDAESVRLGEFSADDRMDMLLKEFPPIKLENEPVYSARVGHALKMIVEEIRNADRIHEAGMRASNKCIFSGAPGVGKTLAAKWMANELGLPLYTLNLAVVMSSYLGKTGNNIRRVFEFASKKPCILFLDEFDAIAKSRSDAADVGELKRLVTVILQSIDNFPDESLLLAATNYPDSLDSAVWRRFDVMLDFPLPEGELIRAAVKKYLGSDLEKAEKYTVALETIMHGKSFSEINRAVTHVRKAALIEKSKIEDKIVEFIRLHCDELDRKERHKLAHALDDTGLVQRDVQALTGVSRDTIRKMKNGVK